jgi:hypothetical protein
MRSRLGLLAAGVLALASTHAAAAAVIPQGGELAVSRTSNSQGKDPSPAFGPGGASLVVWADTVRGVRGQLYAASGAKAGAVLDLVVNQAPPIPGEGPARLALEPAAAFLPDGGFLLAWAEERGHMRVAPFFQHFDVAQRRVFVRRFDANGVAAGRVQNVSSATDLFESWPRLHRLDNGRVLAAWRSARATDATSAGDGLLARQLNPQGRPIGSELRISAEGDGAAQYVTFADAPGGQVLVAWEGCCDAGGDLGIYVRAYDAAAHGFGTIHQVNLETAQKQRRPAIAPAGEDGFLVLWQGIIDRSTGRIFGRFVELDGAGSGTQFQVSHGFSTVQLAPALAAKPGGGFVAVWRDWVTVYPGISAIELDAAGQPAGEPFRLHDRGLQKSDRTYLATDGAGTFLVPWEKGFRGRPSIGARRLVSE